MSRQIQTQQTQQTPQSGVEQRRSRQGLADTPESQTLQTPHRRQGLELLQGLRTQPQLQTLPSNALVKPRLQGLQGLRGCFPLLLRIGRDPPADRCRPCIPRTPGSDRRTR